ncbi:MULTISPECIES: spore coat protein [Bacillota]|jgi:spore coat protein CotF|uniref:Spore coat protein n=1 Tax=Amedibacillus hominis TaxID=2897776 RepID=A0ABS9R479_9FIRM|nr:MULTISPECIES: spore coat protein [Bacillota]MCH4284465.1 spore coat protein [Amedibacillus hominis]RGB48481.1 spore coat protein [Absiella sp. AM22-9]RGB51434.1 spore coat protein [Absiella sp. AM10-20]RGB61129.1 spore coat protein [Absiella sp. AM09-45]RGB71739.1 spore coat protein [Absiella sp. AM09-50]
MSKSKNEYSEKDIATNLLVTLKHMKYEYNTFTQEASNEELFKEIDTLYDCISKQQRNVFDMMCAQGWYKMTADSEKNISKAYTKFSNSESELS